MRGQPLRLTRALDFSKDLVDLQTNILSPFMLALSYPSQILRSKTLLSIPPIALRRACLFKLPKHTFITSTRLLQQIEPKNEDPSFKTKESVEARQAPALSISQQLRNIPNMLTLSRIAATPFTGYFLATGQSTIAISLFAYSAVTDFVDGYLARKYDMKTVLGSILDPAADKFLMTTTTVALAFQSLMPIYVASIIIGRDVALSFASFFVRFRSLPPPKSLKRFLDMSIATHTVHPNFLGKFNTALQMVYIGGLVLQPALLSILASDLSPYFGYFGACVALTTLASGMSYLNSKNSFRVLAK